LALALLEHVLQLLQYSVIFNNLLYIDCSGALNLQVLTVNGVEFVRNGLAVNVTRWNLQVLKYRGNCMTWKLRVVECGSKGNRAGICK